MGSAILYKHCGLLEKQERGQEVKKVRFFHGKVSRQGLEYLGQYISEWAEENNIEMKAVSQTFGQAPTGLSGSLEDVLFVGVWY